MNPALGGSTRKLIGRAKNDGATLYADTTGNITFVVGKTSGEAWSYLFGSQALHEPV